MGYDLPVQTSAFQAKLDDWYLNGHMTELVENTNPDQGLDEFPLPHVIGAPPPKIGRLYWPAFGASRYAYGVYLCDYYTLGQIRNALAGTTEVQVLFDDSEDGSALFPITMHLIAARPVAQQDPLATPPADEPTGEDELYFITLVDARYYWQFQHGSGQASGWTPSSWSDLLETLLIRLGAPDINVDPVNAAYLTPTGKWDRDRIEGKPTAVLADSAASMVGMRVCVDTEGRAWVQSSNVSANRAVLTTLHDDNEDRLNGGGLIADADVINSVPQFVSCIFFNPNDDTIAGATIDQDLAGCSLTQFAGALGEESKRAFAWVDCPDTASGGSQTALAKQFASDWYLYQRAPLDAVFDGLIEPPTSGFYSHAELYHTDSVAFTRIHRAPINYSNLQGKGPPLFAWFWLKIDGGNDASGYSGHAVVLTGPNTWADDELIIPNNTAWRAPSNQVSPILPTIATTQTVLCRKSLTFPGNYEITPWGSQNKVSGLLNSSCVAQDIWGRDLYSAATSPPPPPPPPPVTFAIKANVAAFLTDNTTPAPHGPWAAAQQVNFFVKGVTGGSGTYSYSWAFGDGGTSSSQNPSYTYTTAGSYFPKVTITGSISGSSGAIGPVNGDGTQRIDITGGTIGDQGGTTSITDQSGVPISQQG